MEQVRCYMCGRTEGTLENEATIGHLEYQDGRKACICSICQGLIEKIAESVIRSHLSYALDSHQELSEFIKSIVESYFYQKPEERS